MPNQNFPLSGAKTKLFCLVFVWCSNFRLVFVWCTNFRLVFVWYRLVSSGVCLVFSRIVWCFWPNWPCWPAEPNPNHNLDFTPDDFCLVPKQNFFVWCQSKTFLSGTKTKLFRLVRKQNFLSSGAKTKLFCLVWKQNFSSGVCLVYLLFARTNFVLSPGLRSYFAQTLFFVWCLSGVGSFRQDQISYFRPDFAQSLFFVWCSSGVRGCFRAWSGVLGRIGHSGRLV